MLIAVDELARPMRLPPPLAPDGRPEPPDKVRVVVPDVTIPARNVFGPTAKAIHPFGGITSFDVVAAALELPRVTKAALKPVLYTTTTVPSGSATVELLVETNNDVYAGVGWKPVKPETGIGFAADTGPKQLPVPEHPTNGATPKTAEPPESR
jgi:hypothetical protein